MSTETVTWLRITATEPPDDVLVVVTGYIRNDRSQGRWRGLARRTGDYFMEDTGEGVGTGFYPPTHYFLVPEPPP